MSPKQLIKKLFWILIFDLSNYLEENIAYRIWTYIWFPPYILNKILGGDKDKKIKLVEYFFNKWILIIILQKETTPSNFWISFRYYLL